jgi:diguanylate cyclase (GGDEF)-like protein
MRPIRPGIDREKARLRAMVQIPALTLLVLCVLWITILMRLQVEKASVVRDTQDAARTIARSLQTHTLKTIHDVDVIALLIKYGYETAPLTFDLARYQAYGLITADTALQVTIVGANGHVLASTLPFKGIVDLSDREHFAVHRTDPAKGLFISRPVIGRVSKQWSIQATRRLDTPDGRFGGVIVISENPAYLTDGFYNSAALGRYGMIAVISHHGFTLSRRAGEAPSTTGGALLDNYTSVARAPVATVIDPVDHIERIVASSTIDRYGLTVVAGLSLDEALDDYYRMRRVYVTMAAVISALLIGFAARIMSLVSKLHKRKDELRRLSETDRLTGLYNRGRIKDLLHEAAAAPDAGGKVAAIFVDLDNFKQLNDTYGHQCGDEVLTVLAERLRMAVGEHGAIGRLGGDEFLVVVQAPDAREAGTRNAEAIAQALGVDLTVRGKPYLMRASLGLAVLGHNDTADDLVRKADHAMYEAKKCGRGERVTTWHAFDDAYCNLQRHGEGIDVEQKSPA